jgi:uncharacterized membrane-anchored protein YitT (DUF2179 family)
MSWLRLTGLFLFALGLLLIVIWLFGTIYNWNNNLLVFAFIGAVLFGFGLGLILRSRTKQTPS